MINFNTLPTNKPITEIKPGTYFATVEKAEMKAPKDPSKKPYLSLTFALTNENLCSECIVIFALDTF